MITAFIETMNDPQWRETAQSHGWRRGWSAFRATYREYAEEERINCDVAAISAVLSRLSTRQLRLLGIRSETLFCDVEALVWRAGDARAARDEIEAILDGTSWPMALPAPKSVGGKTDTSTRDGHHRGRQSITQAA